MVYARTDFRNELLTRKQRKKFVLVYVSKHFLFKAQPAISPDLNPLDFLPCGQLKTLVYSDLVEDKKILYLVTVYVFQAAGNRPMTFEVVQQSMVRRVYAYFDPG